MGKQAHEFRFADGLRGYSAIQVVLSHYAAVFLPLFGHSTQVQHFGFEKWMSTSPFFFLIDGGTAVAVFFVISGFVLSGSFSRSDAPLIALATKRWVRLYVPVALACVAAWAMLLAAPEMRDELRVATGTGAFGNGHEIPIFFGGFLKELLLGSMVLGYKGVSLFDTITNLGLAPSVTSVNPPFWTLHVELWGSMLILALCGLRKRLPSSMFLCTLVASVWVCGLSFYVLFLVGFVLEWLFRGRILPVGVAPTLIGLVLIVLGEYVGVTKGEGHVYRFMLWASPHVFGSPYNPYTFQSTVGGIAVFLGIILCEPVRRLLSTAPSLFLGRLSFGLYLFHFPVLVLVGGWAFFACKTLGYGAAISIATSLGIIVAAVIAFLFDKYVDAWAIEWSSRIVQRFSMKADPILQRQATS